MWYYFVVMWCEVRMYWGCIECVLRVYWGCTEGVLRVYWGCIEGVLRVYWGCIEGACVIPDQRPGSHLVQRLWVVPIRGVPPGSGSPHLPEGMSAKGRLPGWSQSRRQWRGIHVRVAWRIHARYDISSTTVISQMLILHLYILLLI